MPAVPAPACSPARLRRFEGRHPEHWVPRFVETGPRGGPGTGGPSAPPQPTERGERGRSLLVGACGAVLRVAPGGHLAWLWGSRPRRLPGARLPASPATVETVVSGCGFLVEACGHRRAPSVCDGVSGTPSPPWVGSRPSGEGHEGALREQPHPGSAPAPAAGTCRDRCCVQPGARPPRAPPPLTTPPSAEHPGRVGKRLDFSGHCHAPPLATPWGLSHFRDKHCV